MLQAKEKKKKPSFIKRFVAFITVTGVVTGIVVNVSQIKDLIFGKQYSAVSLANDELLQRLFIGKYNGAKKVVEIDSSNDQKAKYIRVEERFQYLGADRQERLVVIFGSYEGKIGVGACDFCDLKELSVATFVKESNEKGNLIAFKQNMLPLTSNADGWSEIKGVKIDTIGNNNFGLLVAVHKWYKGQEDSEEEWNIFHLEELRPIFKDVVAHYTAGDWHYDAGDLVATIYPEIVFSKKHPTAEYFDIKIVLKEEKNNKRKKNDVASYYVFNNTEMSYVLLEGDWYEEW